MLKQVWSAMRADYVDLARQLVTYHRLRSLIRWRPYNRVVAALLWAGALLVPAKVLWEAFAGVLNESKDVKSLYVVLTGRRADALEAPVYRLVAGWLRKGVHGGHPQALALAAALLAMDKTESHGNPGRDLCEDFVFAATSIQGVMNSLVVFGDKAADMAVYLATHGGHDKSHLMWGAMVIAANGLGLGQRPPERAKLRLNLERLKGNHHAPGMVAAVAHLEATLSWPEEAQTQ